MAAMTGCRMKRNAAGPLAVDDVVPDAQDDFDCNAMHYDPGDEQQNEGGEDQPGQQAGVLRVVAHHGAVPACLTMQRNRHGLAREHRLRMARGRAVTTAVVGGDANHL